MDGVTRYERAADLPPAWDGLARTRFQTRSFLSLTERTNPCRQRYYLFQPGERVTAGAVVYSLTLDVLTYQKIPSPLRMHFIGLPCSVGWPGLLGEQADLPWLLRGVRDQERGMLVGLNTLAPVDLGGIPQGQTLPTVVVDRPFGSFGDYRRALRSDYRRRLDRIRGAFTGLGETRTDCSVFDGELYRLYEEAWARSDAKLEKLPLAFFQALPPPFRLTVFREGATLPLPQPRGAGSLVGWHVSLFEDGRGTFFMGGVDQEHLERRRTYHNLLFSVLEQAWDGGCTSVDLGQTAEVAKTRAGGRLVPRGLFAWPGNSLLRHAMCWGQRWLEYRCQAPEVRVFR